MKIGLLLNDSGFNGVDLSNPWKGNPGIGGTQYCFIMLAKAIIEASDYEVYCFHFNKGNKLDSAIINIIIEDDLEAIKTAHELNIDVFIMKSPTEKSVFTEIDNQKLPTISWAHNYILGDSLKLHRNTKYIKRVVFVGKQEYDRYIDDDLIIKSDYIYNMFRTTQAHNRNNPVERVVTYTGSLVKQKGFHILARIWKDILQEFPDAKLYVIGNGNLYNAKDKMGKYGLAEDSYERLFIPYLIDKTGNIDSSVHFMGKMGAEKNEIYKITKVGVMNPSARTETFGLSAVEMNDYAIPVCTEGKNGLPDTVVNGVTGLLSHGRKSLQKNIIKLLKDDQYNEKLGIGGKEYINKFNPELIVQDWIKTIEDVHDGNAATYKAPNNCYGNNVKWARIVNRFLRKNMHLTFLKSIVQIEVIGRNIVNKWRKKW